MNRHTFLFVMVVAVVVTVCSGAAEPIRPSYPFGFAPGTRVVLLDGAASVGDGLAVGMAGTVICCDAVDCSGSLLVSWDLWTGGKDDEARCATSPVPVYPAGSAAWVDPSVVMLGRPFDMVGILRQGDAGCLYLETEDSKSYYLVVGPEFGEQWPVVMPGQQVRVRGLLNTNPGQRICPQRDGDVYHPIMAASDWTFASCCDPFVCGFQYGDRVVLVGESNPNGAVGLPRGSSGTIICCNSRVERSVLVSWDLWTNGGPADDYIECNERLTGLFPPGSTSWVPVTDLAKYVQTACGSPQAIRISSDGGSPDIGAAALYVKNVGLYYLPDLGDVATLPEGESMVSGLFAPYAVLPEGTVVTSNPAVAKKLAGTILHSVLMPCPSRSCCEPAYLPGDRVVLLVDEPGGAEGLLAEATGTVVCCNSDDPVTPIFVSWDYWTGGDDNHEACNSGGRPLYYPETSGWWMACKEVEPIVLPDLYDVGEDYRGFAPSSVTAGQGLVITGLIGNRGGRQSDAFFVEIYASTDTEITMDDYFIGLVAMDMDAGGSADLYWTGDFPADIPAGTYNIGWLIDPDDFVKEAKENNNTAVVEAGQLVVP